jgi:hypothetical protein
MKVTLFFIIYFLSFNLISLDLYDLDANKNYLDSGKRLMDLDFGLKDLESDTSSDEIIIAVHGRDSRGFEWIYPLQTIDSDKTKTYFFRWDTTKCPQVSAQLLLKEINKFEDLKKITILGHSAGGVLSSLLLNHLGGTRADIHAIAAPLASIDLLRFCKYLHPDKKSKSVSYYQWRTIKELDYAFNSLDYDPQLIDFKDSSVVRLPRQYRGKRLGHLWSISWVADNINLD